MIFEDDALEQTKSGGDHSSHCRVTDKTWKGCYNKDKSPTATTVHGFSKPIGVGDQIKQADSNPDFSNKIHLKTKKNKNYKKIIPDKTFTS